MLIKNGVLIDKNNGFHLSRKDIRVEDGLIKEVADDLLPYENEEIVDISGLVSAPGFTDIHTHVYHGKTAIGIDPDRVGVEQGVTAVVDAGTAGADTFEDFYERIIKKAKTRVYAFLNIASPGLLSLSELTDLSNIEFEKVKETVEKYKDVIVGIKARASGSVVGENGAEPIRIAKEIAKKLGLPIMVHIGNAPPKVEEVLNFMEKGDIITHCFHNKVNNLIREIGILPEAKAARERGVLFDVGHGNASFSFDTGAKGIADGFIPDFLSTDIYDKNIEKPVKSQITTLNKMLYLGLTLEDCINKLTREPAKALSLGETGEIKTGYRADFTIFELVDNYTELTDSVDKTVKQKPYVKGKYSIVGGKVYECVQ